MVVRNVFITGGTGYLGSRLIPRLVARGHAVRALVRPGSEGKLPPAARRSPATPSTGRPSPRRCGPATPSSSSSALRSRAPQGGAVQGRRPGFGAGVGGGGGSGAGGPLRVRQRCPAGAGDEGLRGGARRGRGADPRVRPRRHPAQTLVRPRARAPLANPADPGLRPPRASATHPRGRTAARAGDSGADAGGLVRRSSIQRQALASSRSSESSAPEADSPHRPASTPSRCFALVTRRFLPFLLHHGFHGTIQEH